ncbi:MAG: GntR family transcriptional regulator [Novosphingobium sp.]
MAAARATPARNLPRTPRYIELADDLRRQILDGTLPAEGFPTESMLCARYGVSRFTVREALRTLQNEGLIQRRRGSGTIVQLAAARGGALHQPLSNVGEILQYARDSRFEFARDGDHALPKAISDQLDIGLPGKWARFRGLRLREGEKGPVAVTDAYIHPDLAAVADRIDVSGETIFRQVERLGRLRIARVTQDIKAVAASAAIAEALLVPRRSPCLRLLRCYVDENDRIVEISVSHHPGDRFAYHMHIEVDA